MNPAKTQISARFAAVLVFLLSVLITPAQAQESAAHTPTAADSAAIQMPAPEHLQHAEGHGEGKLDVKELLFGHILDSHEWHITDIPASWTGGHHPTPVAIHLPYIMYHSVRGLEVFSIHGHTTEEKMASAVEHGYAIDKYGNVKPLNKNESAIDFSITKSVLQMIIVAIVLFIVLLAVRRGYERNAGKAPKGIQSLFEPIIVFVRDDIAKPNMHGKHEKYVPYLLTLFFFIWFSNLFGLTPFNSNIAGNINFTCALAVLTFFIVQFSGTKDYWAHIFWYPGVSIPMKLIIMPIEFVGLFTKPFSLMVRLFANIVGGHFMILALVGLIFIMNAGFGVFAAAGIAPLSIAFTLMIMGIELLVAVIQAYVFTLLTSIFIGMALEEHHHDHGHEHAAH